MSVVEIVPAPAGTGHEFAVTDRELVYKVVCTDSQRNWCCSGGTCLGPPCPHVAACREYLRSVA